MRKGIPCNETRYINADRRDRIHYDFVSDDGNTPSSCTVRLGDTDPATGEPITDVTFFRDYHRFRDHQVMKNLAAVRPAFTPEEKEDRRRRRDAFIAAYTAEHGCPPSGAAVYDYLDRTEAERYLLSMDALVNPKGESLLDRMPAFSVPSFADAVESPMLQALREVAASLTGRKAEVYEAMLRRADGDKDRVRFTDIAKKWGVSPKQITKDQQKIMRMVRKRAQELQEEEE